MPAATPAGTEEGSLPCSDRGCTASTGLACAYVDRRGRSCATAWCPSHRDLVEGGVYCRRHAGVVRALADAAVPGAPDLDNRAPSLVRWVADDVAADVLAMLGELRAPGEDLLDEPVRLSHLGRERTRVWERVFSLAGHTGFRNKIELQVLEEDDTVVVARVNHRAVFAAEPPWISARRAGEPLQGEADARARAAWRQSLLDALRRGLAESA